MGRMSGIGALVLVGSFLLSMSLHSQETKMKIAVLNLNKMSDDVPQGDVLTFSAGVRDAFIKTGRFEVVTTIGDYTQMKINRVLMGSLNKFGDTYIINMQLVDFDSALYISAEAIQATNKIEALNAIDSKVAILARKSYEYIPPVAMSLGSNGSGMTKSSPSDKPEPFSIVPVLNVTGYSLLGVSVISAGLGLFFDISAQNNYKSANLAYADYQNSSSDANWNTFQGFVTNTSQNLTLRNVSYIAGGISLGLGLGCLLTPLFLPKNNVVLSITPDKLTFCYQF